MAHTSPPFVDPTGFFSLTATSNQQITPKPTQNTALTNPHHRRLQLRRRHLLQHPDPRLAEREQARELDRALLQLELRAVGVRREHLRDAVLFGHARRRARGDFGQRGEHELADEVVGVGGVHDGEDEVDEVLVGDLKRLGE
jgi:hypothetical protein